MPQHKEGCQPNQVEEQPKKIQEEVLDVHAGVHAPLEGHLAVD